jgi:hypothetical protein
MYILVRQSDKVIIGTATKLIDEKSAADKGYDVYEIQESEFKPSMLGSKLQGFDKG